MFDKPSNAEGGAGREAESAPLICPKTASAIMVTIMVTISARDASFV